MTGAPDGGQGMLHDAMSEGGGGGGGAGARLPHSHSTPAGVDGTGGGARTPPATPKKGGKMLAVRVQMLDDSVTMFQVQAKALGRVLFDQVCKQLHLLEADYFGLEYQDTTGTKYWLDLEKPMSRQVGLSLVDTLLRFCVKFYTPDPAQLEEEFTRYLFCLQIKRDLAQGLLQCNDNTAALMASYIVQAECGDYVVEDYPDHTYLSTYKFVPNQDPDLERRIMENHKKHAGQSPAEADLNLLETSRRCELYGMKMHPAKDHEGVPLNLAVAHMGIVVFQNYTKINTFSWAKIRKISFKRKRFLIKLHPEGYGYYKDTVEFFFEGRNECKNFWKKCVENHGFFRCSSVKHVPRQKTRVLSRGSSFRYSGRTQKQIVEFVRENYVKRQTFQRSQSFRHAHSAPSSVASVGASLSAHPLLPLGENAVVGTPASLSCGSMTLASLTGTAERLRSRTPPTTATRTPARTTTATGAATADVHEWGARSPSPSAASATSAASSPLHSLRSLRSTTSQGGQSSAAAAAASAAAARPGAPPQPPPPATPLQLQRRDQPPDPEEASSRPRRRQPLPLPTTPTQTTTTTITTTPDESAMNLNNTTPVHIENHHAHNNGSIGSPTSMDADSLRSPELSPTKNIRNDPTTQRDWEVEPRKKRFPVDRAYFIAKEILMTERTYRKDLEVITVWFREEVGREAESPAVEQLLGLLDPIHEAHCAFLREVETRLATWEGRGNAHLKGDYQRIGDVLLRNLLMLPLYEEYLLHHLEVLQRLDEALSSSARFEQLYRDFEQQKVCYLPLTAFVLKPLQRLLHYQMLLNRLLQHYPKDHPDYEDCYAAKSKLSATAVNVPAILKESENFVQLCELQRDMMGFDNLVQAERDFLRQGCLMKLSRKGYQQRMFFLFSDVLLYASRTAQPCMQFRVHGQLPLRGVLVEEAPDNRMGASYAFTIYGGNRALTVAASSQEEKDKWLEDLSDAVQAAKFRGDNRLQYLSLKSCSSSDEVMDKCGDDGNVSREKTTPVQRRNTTVHVCWHRNTSISMKDELRAVENQLSGYLLRKFKNSNGWQKLWVVFTNFCLFFYKTFQDDFPLASLPLLGYSVTTPAPTDGIAKDYVFKLQFKNHVYFFRAESEYTFGRWMEVTSSATQHSGRMRLFSRKDSVLGD